MKVQELSDNDDGRIFLSIPLPGEMAVCAHEDICVQNSKRPRKIFRKYASKTARRYQNRGQKAGLKSLGLCVN